MLYDSMFDNFPLYLAGFERGFRSRLNAYDLCLHMLTYNSIPTI
jgi:hypothetical protein